MLSFLLLPNNTGKQRLAVTLTLILLFLIEIDIFMWTTKHTKYSNIIFSVKKKEIISNKIQTIHLFLMLAMEDMY